MPGKHSRDKGRRYENEVVGWLMAHGFNAKRISAMYQTGPDIEAFGGRYIECRLHETFESMNVIMSELDSDASLYFTRPEGQRGDHLVILWASTLLDLIDERHSDDS